MTTDELELYLQGQAESQTLDFKAAMPWNVISFAKDILAFSNVQDGGRIIIGIQDATFVRQGITDAQRDSYKIDIMRDQMTSFSDPHVNFSVDFPLDQHGKRYACIRIEPFEEIPVICRKDSADTKAGAIYYRNRNRRVESAQVSNSYDMREIIEISALRMMQRKRQLGFTVGGETVKQQQESEALARARAELDRETEGL